MNLTGSISGNKALQGKTSGLKVYYTDAYALAVANGFEGTIDEWLESLNGEDGFSPKVSFEKVDGGTRIIITDADGEHSAIVYDGDAEAVKTVNGVKPDENGNVQVTGGSGTVPTKLSDLENDLYYDEMQSFLTLTLDDLTWHDGGLGARYYSYKSTDVLTISSVDEIDYNGTYTTTGGREGTLTKTKDASLTDDCTFYSDHDSNDYIYIFMSDDGYEINLVFDEYASQLSDFQMEFFRSVTTKIPGKYVDINIAPDMNENDPSSSNYIRNRTHYSVCQYTQVFAEQDITLDEVFYDCFNACEVHADYEDISEGDTYEVVWDGVTYTGTIKRNSMWENVLYAGNASICSDAANTGEPFYIYGNSPEDGDSCLIVSTTIGDTDEHTVSFRLVDETVHQIDPKFIPATVPVIQSASVGQTIVVKAVDDSGKPTEWEAADLPSGGEKEWTLLANVTVEEDVRTIEITEDSDGNPICCHEVFIMQNTSCAESSKQSEDVCVNGSIVIGSMPIIKNTGYFGWAQILLSIVCNRVTTSVVYTDITTASPGEISVNAPYNYGTEYCNLAFVNADAITTIKLQCKNSTVSFAAGSSFLVYGR